MKSVNRTALGLAATLMLQPMAALAQQAPDPDEIGLTVGHEAATPDAVTESAGTSALVINGGAALVYAIKPDGPGSNNTLTFQPYVEVERNGLYAGLSASLSKTSVEHEIDLYFGYHNETNAGLSYDIGYTRYFYPNDGGDCCGEITLSLGVSPSDKLSLSIGAAFDPEAGHGATSLGAEYLITDKIGLAADIGVTGIGTESEWDVGANYYVNDKVTVSLYYNDGSNYPGYFELGLSYDTTLLGQ